MQGFHPARPSVCLFAGIFHDSEPLIFIGDVDKARGILARAAFLFGNVP
jgi:hypothetical protein